MAINDEVVSNIISGLDSLPRKSEIDTPTNNIDLDATEELSGLMSAKDKKKLNKIAEEANHYELPEASTTLGGVKTTSTVTDISDYLPVPIVGAIPYYKPYILPIASPNTLGGIKAGSGVDISADGTLTIKSVNSDNFVGVLAVEKGGTGSSTKEGARKTLNILKTVIVGNLNYGITVSGNAYYHALTIRNVKSNNVSAIKLAVFTADASFILDIKVRVTATAKEDPIVSVDVPATDKVYSLIDKLYVIMDSSTASGSIEIWYKDNSLPCKLTVLQASNGYINASDELDFIDIAASPNSAVDVVGTSLPNVFKLTDVEITSRVATTTREGYISAEDKTKLDQMETKISTAITNLSNILTPKINGAYNNITLASPKNNRTDEAEYSDLITTTVYTFRKVDGTTTQIELPNTIRSYNTASSNNNGLMSKEHYDYIESLPTTISDMKEILGTEKCLPLIGGSMTGNISYKGSNSTDTMIEFMDNTSNNQGNGLAIGGNGLTIISSGESRTKIKTRYGVTQEKMVVGSDAQIIFFSNYQNDTTVKEYTMDSGQFSSESFNASDSYKMNDKAAIKYDETDDCIDFMFM